MHGDNELMAVCSINQVTTRNNYTVQCTVYTIQSNGIDSEADKANEALGNILSKLAITAI